jgi:hypothetical protein
MKKLVAVFLTLAVTATMAFADMNVGGWGRTDFVPLYGADVDGDDDLNFRSFTGVNWGGPPRFSFTVSGSSGDGKSGVQIKLQDGGFAGEETFVWVKPIDQFRLNLGEYYWGNFRGPGAWDSFRQYIGDTKIGDGDPVFNRLNSNLNGTVGATIELYPVENLSVGVMLPTAKRNFNIPNVTPEDMFKAGQYVAGYNIPNIGLFRAGYFGTADFKPATVKAGEVGGVIQAAFRLTAVQNLSADLGFTFGMDTVEKANNMNIALGASYSIPDMLSAQLLANFSFGGSKEGGGGFTPEVYINPELTMLPIAVIGFAFRWSANFDLEDNSSIGFDIYAKKQIGIVELKGGFALAMAPKAGGTDKKDVTFAVPIQMTYGF